MKELRKVLDSKTGTENQTGTEKLEPPSYRGQAEPEPLLTYSALVGGMRSVARKVKDHTVLANLE
jgi:hypothetical protein